MGVLFWGIIWVMQAFQSQLLEQAPSPCAIVNTGAPRNGRSHSLQSLEPIQF